MGRRAWGSRASRLRSLVALGLALIALLARPGVGLAHSNLLRSDPADGATLSQSPGEARLWFSEEIEPAFSRAVAFDAESQPVSFGSHVAADDPRLLVVTMAPALATGWYRIDWQAQAKLDGHLTRGSIAFGIGVAGPPPRIADAAAVAATGSGSPVEVGLRWLILLSAVVLVGSFAFWLLQSGNSPPKGHVSRGTRIGAGQWVVAELAWTIFLVANVVFLTNAVANASEATSLDDLGPPLVQLATQTTFGQLWLAREAIAFVIGMILLDRATSPASTRDWIALALGGGLLLSISLTSHSASVATLAPVAIANDWLHLASVALWVGGVVQLAVALAAPPASGDKGAGDGRWALLRRFGAIAPYLVALVAVTGFFEAANHVATFANLVSTHYGQVVLLKTALLVPLAMVATGHRTLIRSAAATQHRAPTTRLARLVAATRADTWLRRWIRLEALWLVLLLAVVGLLTSLSPP